MERHIGSELSINNINTINSALETYFDNYIENNTIDTKFNKKFNIKISCEKTQYTPDGIKTTIQVSRIQINNTKYLIRRDNNKLYDTNTKECIGIWNELTKTIDDEEDEEDEEDRLDDLIQLLFYSNFNFGEHAENYFNKDNIIPLYQYSMYWFDDIDDDIFEKNPLLSWRDLSNLKRIINYFGFYYAKQHKLIIKEMWNTALDRLNSSAVYLK